MTKVIKQAFKRQLPLILTTLLFVVLATFFFAYLKLSLNVQKGSNVKTVKLVHVEDVDYFLDNLNHERYTKESKQRARKFIISQFRNFGYSVREQEFENGVNIIAEKNVGIENYVLIGAHFDTVPNTTGTDDNGSGVAALLSIAKYNKNPNLKFVAFDTEEYLLSGSNHFVRSSEPKPSLAVILETIGYTSDEINSQKYPEFYKYVFPGLFNRLKNNQYKGNFSTIVCVDSAKNFCNSYEEFGSALNLEVYSIYIPFPKIVSKEFVDLFRSDHTPFLLEDIPAVMITDTANFRNPGYHLPSDKRDTVSSEFIAKQANSVLSILQEK